MSTNLANRSIDKLTQNSDDCNPILLPMPVTLDTDSPSDETQVSESGESSYVETNDGGYGSAVNEMSTPVDFSFDE